MKANAKFFGWASIILLVGIVAIILFVPKRIEEGKIKTFGSRNASDEMKAISETSLETTKEA